MRAFSLHLCSFFVILGRFHRSVTLNSPNIAHSCRSNHPGGDSERTPDGLFPGWERMFDLSDRGFHSRPQVSALFQVNLIAPAPLGDIGLGLRET